VRYTLARGETEPEEKPDVVLTGNGQRLVYRRGNPTPSREVNQKEIKFTEVGPSANNHPTFSLVWFIYTLSRSL
jgi:hypothetical protein